MMLLYWVDFEFQSHLREISTDKLKVLIFTQESEKIHLSCRLSANCYTGEFAETIAEAKIKFIKHLKQKHPENILIVPEKALCMI